MVWGVLSSAVIDFTVCLRMCVSVCMCVLIWTQWVCDSSCGGQSDSMGITTASHTRPSETKQCWDMADFHIQHQSEHTGDAVEVPSETHTREAWQHELMYWLCVLKSVYSVLTWESVFVWQKSKALSRLCFFFPSLWEKFQAVSEASSSLKKVMVRRTFLSLLLLHFSFLCLSFPLQPELKDMSLQQAAGWDKPLSLPLFSPLSLTHSLSLFSLSGCLKTQANKLN